MTKRLALILVVALSGRALGFANGGGLETFTKVGCGGGACHTGAAAPGMELVGPTKATAGMASSYALTITGGPASVGGISIEAENGTIADATGMLSSRGQGQRILVHSAPARFVANALRYTFELTPTGAGPVSLHVATASCDGKMDGAGDGAQLQTLQVEVESGGKEPGPVIPEGESVDAGVAPPGGSAVEGDLSCQTARGLALTCAVLTLARRRGQICARRR